MEQFVYRSIQITEINQAEFQNGESATASKDYRVEEPLDFIFEPNHNPPREQRTSEVTQQRLLKRLILTSS